MNEETKEFFKKWRTPILTLSIGLLLVLSAGLGFMYGKTNICHKSGGVLALVPGSGEQCVTRFVDAADCQKPLSANDLIITARFCRDEKGLFPLGMIK